MRVLQLIDSLDAGGAERLAVNLANGLSVRIEKSFLCATRKEGLLKEAINNNVSYFFLKKKYKIDIKSIIQLNRFTKQNKIQVLHAHSSSFFLATIIKFFNPKLVLVWHDHYGQSEFLDRRPKMVLKFCSLLFDRVLCVNSKLEKWNRQTLNVSAVDCLSNFAVITEFKSKTNLKGSEGKRIVCLANLRPQKDHLNLLRAFKRINILHPDWTLHLIGQDFNDKYSNLIKSYITENYLDEVVFIYGSCLDTFNILKQSDIGVLTSKSEGLPLSLLEYGLAGLPSVTTNVGDCSKVISSIEEGFLIQSENENVLFETLLILIKNKSLRFKIAKNFQQKVLSKFSEDRVISSLLSMYKKHQI